MIEFARCSDLELIRELMTRPRIYNRIVDDFKVQPHEFSPQTDSRILYVMARENGRLIGLFILIPLSTIMYDLHVCILPECWGEPSFRACMGFRKWVWENTACQRLICGIPEFHRSAIRLARLAGAQIWGVNEKALLKSKKLHNVVMLGLSRPEKP